MTRAELDAAGLADQHLRRSYQRCRLLNARYGRTYFLATRLLAPGQRPAIHALYGFARMADDIVDNGDVEREARLGRLSEALLAGLATGSSTDPVLAAVVHAARRYAIDTALFEDFLRSMRMDLTVRDYPDRSALERYMRGSAESIGLQVLPVLGTVGEQRDAAPYAAALGRAFQLTNFLRDVAEDLARGRIYLPADELAAHGVDRAMLEWCLRSGVTHPRVRAALAAQHARTRQTYRYARDGVAMLHPVSRPCVATALQLYSEILDRIEDSGFAVFAARARVGTGRRARIAGPALLRALRARHGRPKGARDGG